VLGGGGGSGCFCGWGEWVVWRESGVGARLGWWSCRCCCNGREKSSGEKEDSDEMDGDMLMRSQSSVDPVPPSSGSFILCVYVCTE